MIYSFNINHTIKWVPTGIEYAELYREQLFAMRGIPCKFIFTEMFPNENIQLRTSYVGLKDEDIIWMYQFFTDFHIERPSFQISKIVAGFECHDFSVNDTNEYREFVFKDQERIVRAYFVAGEHDITQKVVYYVNGHAIFADHYSYLKIFTDYYRHDPEEGDIVACRHFYNEDGSIAYEEYIQGNHCSFRFKDRLIDSEQEFIGWMIKCLNAKKGDIFLIDRTKEIGQGLFENAGEIPLIRVLHADHYVSADDCNILWRSGYEYTLDHPERITAYISATSKQKEVLREQFRKYYHVDPAIVDIPVGSIHELKRPVIPRKHHALMIACRLTNEKNIEQGIRAVTLARKSVPDLSFDIYGWGYLHKRIARLIKDLNASEYIHMMGFQQMDEIDQQYEGYLQTSLSEGFGLALLEALGAGLPAIGFDVPYGNQTMIVDQKNGYLVPYDEKEKPEKQDQDLAEAIVKLFTRADWETLSEESYRIAEEYLSDRVADQWVDLISSVGGTVY